MIRKNNAGFSQESLYEMFELLDNNPDRFDVIRKKFSLSDKQYKKVVSLWLTNQRDLRSSEEEE